jgi:hypothetical protein
LLPRSNCAIALTVEGNTPPQLKFRNNLQL